MEADVTQLWLKLKNWFDNGKLEFDPSKGKEWNSFSAREGANYCGPGWGFTREDVASGRIKELPHPIDSIDGACMAHDQCYADNGYFSAACDAALIMQLQQVIAEPSSTEADRIDAAIMTGVFTVLHYTVDQAVGVYRDAEALYDEIALQFRRNMQMEQIVNGLLRYQ